MKLFYDPNVFTDLASDSLKVHEQAFCKWVQRIYQTSYTEAFNYIKDKLKCDQIISWEDWHKCPPEKLETILKNSLQAITTMYNEFNYQHGIYFTEQDLSVLACKMCLAALHELRVCEEESI